MSLCALTLHLVSSPSLLTLCTALPPQPALALPIPAYNVASSLHHPCLGSPTILQLTAQAPLGSSFIVYALMPLERFLSWFMIICFYG